jgi:hypothetical protein
MVLLSVSTKYDSDSIISILQDIDKLIDERREMIETIQDLQTRVAAHTQIPQPDPTTESLLSELCAALGWQGGTRADALERVRVLNSIANRCAQDVNYHQ